MKVGKNIKEIREDNKITLQTVADGIGISLEEYQKIENDEVDITLNLFDAIANQISSSVVDILQLHDASKGIRNYFHNNNGNQGTIINVQGINQEEIRKAYKELYATELKRVPLLEKLLRDYKIEFDF